MPKRVLFIGNSYTHGFVRVLSEMLRTSAPGTVIEAITPGGYTLAQHLENTTGRIKSGNWDVVVLQEQSLVSTLAGPDQDRFFSAVRELCAMVREQGARPVLYETWGRRDGHGETAKVNPDYETMQRNLTAAYRKAGSENNADVVPVGSVWSVVRNKHPELGRELYEKDGSHPSRKGQWLIACIYMKYLFDTDPDSVPLNDCVSEAEAKTFRACTRAL